MTVVSRQESSATFPEGITVVKSDFSPSHLEQTFKGSDAIVSTITTTAIGEQLKIVDAASQAGVKRFITSDFGSDVSDPAVLKAVPILGGKKEVVDHLKTKEKDGLTWSAIVNGAFTSFVSFCSVLPLLQDPSILSPISSRSLQGLETGFLGFDLENKAATLYDGGDRPFTQTTYEKVAQSVVAVLSKPSETANRYLYISSFNVSQKTVLSAIEQATGEKFTVSNSTTASLQESGLKALQAGGGPDVALLILFGILGEGNGGDYGLAKNDNALLGLEGEDLLAVVKDIVQRNK